ncbi:MAG: exodeoxyribonuclease VII small subunit [Petrimonas sp.]|jgi:exodeoxyribonuclease VII small subunit|uniref:exodeoxyribonuclease VII small subunit n=1 Tax=Petrimonas sp. TaxID=2023866 RepID=UPI002B3CCF39|nr:exodeoxyribonuclease VII small subunit [Petrimonas sp.]HMM16088.1 exodeoxyribonuclease VII small subunit [Petrimonas sp.]
MKESALTYSQAKQELEEIVSAIESGELDVDALTEKVKRASKLIAFCKERLTKTDEELQKILDEIN